MEKKQLEIEIDCNGRAKTGDLAKLFVDFVDMMALDPEVIPEIIVKQKK